MRKRSRKKSTPWGRWLTPLGTAVLLIGSVTILSAAKAPSDVVTPTKIEAAKENLDAGAAKPDTVRILLQTSPARRAFVRWGRKSLGVIPGSRPMVLVRPRDSGPLDLVIRASGYLPVHTRAYTFSDSRVVVKLTTPEEKSKLFGYREEIPPAIDGGVPDPTPAPATPAANQGMTPMVPAGNSVTVPYR
jgi:hypothetical protein